MTGLRPACAEVPGTSASFAAIDWRRPWLRTLAPVGMQAAQRVIGGDSVAQALNRAPLPSRVEFVSQQALPPDTAYEQFVFDTRTVPTRDNLHDFFNGLIWLHYPQTKRLFNQWQAHEIAAQGIGAVRGSLRDAVTLFDENGALLWAPAPLREALKNREWRRLGEELRPLWQQSRLVPVGHALLEKLVQPRKSITAHVHFVDGDEPGLDFGADATMAARFDAAEFAMKPFNPLPVLGVPGWWRENENVCFYDDPEVFRSGPRKTSQQDSAAGTR
ncbi:DUF3025 domain-containing protein [Diaphorobacter aerolatus]|uniref:DUF3025 domain-containing protein n=1 Tax=Diaphorobacter aerolatus TaxID=1288495 RepID=A0A7H0GHD6_9BURK|nr:DUF3025 domain-containing protein [Diaphorobacter aerolatus]QNP47702.1 DUF3025 domain-containing protein [Diaphorobacter aerolatus]